MLRKPPKNRGKTKHCHPVLVTQSVLPAYVIIILRVLKMLQKRLDKNRCSPSLPFGATEGQDSNSKHDALWSGWGSILKWALGQLFVVQHIVQSCCFMLPFSIPRLELVPPSPTRCVNVATVSNRAGSSLEIFNLNLYMSLSLSFSVVHGVVVQFGVSFFYGILPLAYDISIQMRK